MTALPQLQPDFTQSRQQEELLGFLLDLALEATAAGGASLQLPRGDRFRVSRSRVSSHPSLRTPFPLAGRVAPHAGSPRTRLPGAAGAPPAPRTPVALADPHTAFTREETSYPGRRIALLVDGSSSMVMKFESKTLRTSENRAFYTAVAAAEHFMKLRMNGRYHDLIDLIQFGNEANADTQFPTHHDNLSKAR